VKGKQQVERLKLLHAYISDLKLRRMMKRTFFLFQSANEVGQRAVRLFDTLLSLHAQIRALPDPPEARTDLLTQLNEELDATQWQLKAWRSYHLGLVHAASEGEGKFRKALGLLNLSRSLATRAHALHSARPELSNGGDTIGERASALDQMVHLEALIRHQTCLVHAASVLARAQQSQPKPGGNAVGGEVETLSAAVQEGDQKMLLQRLRSSDGGTKDDEYRGVSLPYRIFALPPPFEPVPVRPLTFDVASNGIEVPSLDHRIESKNFSSSAAAAYADHAEFESMSECESLSGSDKDPDSDTIERKNGSETENKTEQEQSKAQKGWFGSFWGS